MRFPVVLVLRRVHEVEVLAQAEMRERRIDQAAKFVPLEQLCLSPQCGFASSEEGNILAEDEQWAKLRMIVEIANEVWG